LFAQFDKMFKLEFNPSASVIGSVISQEILKVITLKDHPNHGLFIYDSVNQAFTIEQNNQ